MLIAFSLLRLSLGPQNMKKRGRRIMKRFQNMSCVWPNYSFSVRIFRAFLTAQSLHTAFFSRKRRPVPLP